MVETAPKRPLSVWLAQVVLIGVALFLLWAPIGSYLATRSTLDYYKISPDHQSRELIKGLMVSFAITVPFALGAVIGFWGLARRTVFGRWVSFVFFSGGSLVLGSLLILALQVRHTEQTETARLLIVLLLTGIFILLAMRLAFGDSERTFFSWKETSPDVVPPPPPSFDA